MRQAGYSSVKLYLQAAMRRQETARQEGPQSCDPRPPGNKLKVMVVIQPRAPSAPWDGQLPSHGADALVVVTWFMLREIECASAKVGDISVSFREVTLQIPTHKTAQQGEPLLTVRTLCCACGVVVHPLCPVHAAARHLARLRALGADSPNGPLFPDRLGGRLGGHAGEGPHRLRGRHSPGHRPGRRGPQVRRHAARVTGASFLVANGVPLPTVQLLGRWSSVAIERYSQAAPLAFPQADLALRNSTAAQEGSVAAPPIREAVLRVAGANPRPQGVAGAPRSSIGKHCPGTGPRGDDGQFSRHHAPSHSQGPPP